MSNKPPPPGKQYQRIFLNSRREAIVIFCLWAVCLVWAVPYCYLNGFPKEFDPDSFSTFLGVPAWLFGGIVLPWLLADVFTTWFCFFFMKDDDLEEGVNPESFDAGGGGDDK